MEEIKFKAEGDDSFLVFGSAKKSSNHTSSTYLDHRFSIQDRIKTALSAFNSNYRTEIQVQFWAATTEGDRRLLTTLDQPFAYHCRSDEKWMKYMTDCPNKKFVAEGEEDLNLTDDGPVSRVFRTQFPEASPDLSIYSVKEYPERDLALGCGFQATLVLPVFEPTLQLRVCVGVIEILFTKYIDIVLYHYIDWARRMLQSIATGFRGYVLEFFLPPDKSHSGDLHNFLSSIVTILKQHLKHFEVVNIGSDLFTEIGYLNESNAEADNTSFTSFHTISSLRTSSDHETTSSSRSIESTMNSTQRKLNNYTRPSGNKSYLDPSPSKINEPVDSETGSSGRVMISASQYQVPTMKVSRGDSSLSNAPCSESSAIVARTIPPSTMVDVEMVNVNENYDEEL